MAFINAFNPAPAPWLPFRDRQVVDRVAAEDFRQRQGRNFECPDFELRVVHDVHNYFAIDLFQRVRMSALTGERLKIILPSPENAVFISLAENLNKYQVSAANAEIFFLYEYANEKAEAWKKGQSEWGYTPEDIEALSSVDYTLFTPGSSIGNPINIMASFAAPESSVVYNEEATREEIATAVTALLGLIG